MIRKGDVLANLIDSTTGEWETYVKETLLPDGTPINDTNVLPLSPVYRKMGSEYFVKNQFKQGGRIDVKWFGVSEDNNDNKIQIDAAIAAANVFALSNASNIQLYFPPSPTGYRTTGGHIVNRFVDVVMDGKLVDINPASHICMTLGEQGSNNSYRNHKIYITRSGTRLVWQDENDIGLKTYGDYFSTIHVTAVTGFGINHQIAGDGAGVAYSKYYIGNLADGYVQLDLHQSPGGWVNENNFYGGEYRVSSSNRTESRIGVRITSEEDYPNNNNKFFGPSFELHGSQEGAFTRPIHADGARFNFFYGCRNEAGDASSDPALAKIFAEESGSAGFNEYYVSFGDSHQVINTEVGNNTSSTIYHRPGAISNKGRVIFNSGNLAKRSWVINGIHYIKGDVAFCNRNTGALMTSNNQTNIFDNRYVSTFHSPCTTIDTSQIKRFGVTVSAKMDEASTGRIRVKAYDSLGVELINDGTTEYVTGFQQRDETTFGGNYYTPSNINFDMTGARYFAVNEDVATVVLIVEATRLESFCILSHDKYDAGVYSGLAKELQNMSAPAAPTSGDWALGEIVFNSAPTVGEPAGWICVSAGSPGTWGAFGTIA